MKYVMVSAGHHAYRKGAVYKDFNEHDEAKVWQSIICNFIGSDAMAVPSGILKSKVEFINNNNPICAIEIHFNSAKKLVNSNDGTKEEIHVGEGSETLYYPGSSKGEKLASWIQVPLGKIFAPDRGIKEGWYKLDKKNGPDFFLQRTSCPSVIIEPDFVHRFNIINALRYDGCKAIANSVMEALNFLRD